ncbi:MAG: 4-alpha-glucanotransferase [Myxococcota bacterium]
MNSAAAAAKALLGIDRLILSIPDAACPWSAGEDLGRGSLYAAATEAFLKRMVALGFTGIQVTPPGRTSPVNPSPYDGSFFSRNELTVRAYDLLDDELLRSHLSSTRLDAALERMEQIYGPTDHRVVNHSDVHGRSNVFLESVHREVDSALTRGLAPALKAELSRFQSTHASWLPWDRAFAARYQPSLARGEAIPRYDLDQFLVHRQHERFRRRLGNLNLELWGDLQVGMGPADQERLRHWFLPNYRMGAPPSRTNPRGQPWGFPVYHPKHWGPNGGARRVFVERLHKLAGEYDGLRVDHPHGLVCPWVYRTDTSETDQVAVQRGARLFESPDLEDHPILQGFARVTRNDLNPSSSCPRYADDWVVHLDDATVEIYAELMSLVVSALDGRLACEVLSTEPYPLKRVRERLRLGRFMVTQKADPDDPEDVYRSERASVRDWVMMGNHDTPTIWGRIREWSRSGQREREALYLGRRLHRLEPDLTIRELLSSDFHLAQAKLTDLFLSPARNVVVFFGDLFGIREPYNRPGVVAPENWSLRVPSKESAPSLDLPAALADALAAKAIGDDSLVEQLRSMSFSVQKPHQVG